MKIKAIITGSTGMVGKGVLLECLKSDEVESVLIINRKSDGMKHPKLKEILHHDFSDVSSISHEMTGYNACFFCLGISSAGLSEQEYHKITYDLTIGFAATALQTNPEMCFCYISGTGTDETEKSRMMWARVKGKAENTLLAMNFKSAYMFRPGFIIPLNGIRSRTALYNSMYFLMSPFYSLLKKLPKYVTDTEKLGEAMIYVASNGYKSKILESIDINGIALNK